MFGSAVRLLAAASIASVATAQDFSTLATRTITKDVVILGGGASGAHAAVRLREDYGKTVVIVEKGTRLGGHVATYVDPVTHNPYDFGVNSYTDYPGAQAFFGRFNVSLVAPTRLALTTTFADFTTGKPSGFVNPAAANVTAGLIKYLELCVKYEYMILPSYASFPTAPPEDLTLKFGDFVAKYALEAIVPRMFQVTVQGMGNMLDSTTLYVMQAFGAPITRSFIGQAASYVPTSHKNQELYDKISHLFGQDVLYSSTAISSKRTATGVEILVKGKGPDVTLIRAKKLLVAFEPTLANFKGIELDAAETDVFSKWDWTTVYVGVVNHPSLPVNFSITNAPAASVPNNWIELPKVPFVTRFDYMGDSNFRVLVTGSKTDTTCSAQNLVKKTFKDLVSAGTLPATTERLKIAAWSNHGAMHLRVSGSELKAGFITKQYALQGRSSTFYTGGAWSAQFSTILWEYNNQFLLPKLVQSL